MMEFSATVRMCNQCFKTARADARAKTTPSTTVPRIQQQKVATNETQAKEVREMQTEDSQMKLFLSEERRCACIILEFIQTTNKILAHQAIHIWRTNVQTMLAEEQQNEQDEMDLAERLYKQEMAAQAQQQHQQLQLNLEEQKAKYSDASDAAVAAEVEKRMVQAENRILSQSLGMQVLLLVMLPVVRSVPLSLSLVSYFGS